VFEAERAIISDEQIVTAKLASTKEQQMQYTTAAG
jgi:hypothetical protein